MKFCSQCGASVEKKIPPGDLLARYVCTRCQVVHYQNPLVVTGCLPQWQDKVLLCKRAIEPRLGYWTLPAGFLENGETIAEGAARETREEALAEVEILELFSVINVPHIRQVHMFYLARLDRPEFGPSHESLEVGLYGEQEIPWDEIAFPTVYRTLKAYFEDRRAGRYRLHVMDIPRPPPRPAQD
jgi:ADP-ribose pyrophosphatase YjhB (NUDIX family)